MGSFFGIFRPPGRPPKPTPVPPPVVIPPPVAEGPMEPRLIATGVNPIGMSYWRNINNHAERSTLDVVLSVNDELILFTIAKSVLQVVGHRALGIHHTGEGCYFSAVHPNMLYVPMDHALVRVNVDNGIQENIWVPGNKKLWQCHTSYDDATHSATIKDSNYKPVLWGVLKNMGREQFFEIKGTPDECQIDKSGQWLVVKEDNYNRIIQLDTEREHKIENEAGALGHSDNGFGCMLGENDYSPHPGALDYINLLSFEQRFMFSTGIWNMGYVSFTNARPGPIEDQYCLVTTPTELWKVSLNGSGIGELVCPNLTESQEYEHRPKANLCPHGQYAVWTAFINGVLNAYLIRIP